MTDRSDDNGYGRQDGNPSENDAWWLSRGRTPTRPSGDTLPESAPDEQAFEAVSLVEDQMPAEAAGDDDDEIVLAEPEIILAEPDLTATWFSLERTITLRADEARARIVGIATAGARPALSS